MFDGDESTIHAPQSLDVLMEMALIMNVKKNIMNAQTNKNIMGVIFDSLTSAYLMTQPETVIKPGVMGELIMLLERPFDVEDFYRRLERDRTSSVADFVYHVLAAQEDNVRSGWYYFWDPLAAAIATEEGLATFREMTLVVVEEEGAESGRTLESDKGNIIRVAMTADRERFEALFLDAVNGRLP